MAVVLLLQRTRVSEDGSGSGGCVAGRAVAASVQAAAGAANRGRGTTAVVPVREAARAAPVLNFSFLFGCFESGGTMVVADDDDNDDEKRESCSA